MPCSAMLSLNIYLYSSVFASITAMRFSEKGFIITGCITDIVLLLLYFTYTLRLNWKITLFAELKYSRVLLPLENTMLTTT
jgi:hypothetical protein